MRAVVDARREVYEQALAAALADAFAAEPRLTVRPLSVAVRPTSGRRAVASLDLRYIQAARGHVLEVAADEPAALRELREQVAPPYGSNLLSDAAMAFTSSGERDRVFAPTAGGAVVVPQGEREVAATCAWVVGRLTEVFVPRVLDLVDLRPGVVDGVLRNPDHYAYPVLTVVAAMRLHGIGRDEVDTERLLGRRVSRNRAFDAHLLGPST